MPIIEWKKQYLIGEQQIDLHHQYLFSLLNKTYDDFVNKESADRLSSTFDDLIDYAIYHFSTEEQLMERCGFPGLSEHKKEHDLFTKKVVDIQKGYHDGERGISLELLSFLQDWLSTHILLSDVEIGRYLVSRNRRKSLGSRNIDINV